MSDEPQLFETQQQLSPLLVEKLQPVSEVVLGVVVVLPEPQHWAGHVRDHVGAADLGDQRAAAEARVAAVAWVAAAVWAARAARAAAAVAVERKWQEQKLLQLINKARP